MATWTESQDEEKVSIGEVVFVTGPENTRTKTLRGILMLSSVPFREILTSTSGEDPEAVHLPDVDTLAFRVVIGVLNGQPLKNSLSVDNMIPILYIARKFDLALTKQVTKYVGKHLRLENVLDVYHMGQQYNDITLLADVWRWMSRQPAKKIDPIIVIIMDELDADGLAGLFANDFVAIPEDRIFKHVVDWLKRMYQRTDPDTHQEPRIALEKVIPEIRFPLMSSRFLSEDVYRSGIISTQELLTVYRAQSLRDSSLTRFKSSKRRRQRNTEMDDDDEDGTGNELDQIIKCVKDSGTCNGYPPSNMFDDTTNYWCSSYYSTNTGDCWTIFDLDDVNVTRMSMKFQSSYTCSGIKLETSDAMDDDEGWEELVIDKDVSTGLDTSNFNDIDVSMASLGQFLKVSYTFTNYYAGVERVKFFDD